MTLLLMALLLLGSAIFSGSETGFYSLSRLRIAAEARRGSITARMIDFLVRSPSGFLITLLVGNNLCLELLTHLTEDEVSSWPLLPPMGLEVTVTLLLTPLLFLFGELFPKDLFRRRPRRLLGALAPILALSRLVFLPVVLPLQGISWALERMLGVRPRDLERALGRERLLEVMREGAREGVLAPEAQELAFNAIELRSRTVSEVLVPWADLEVLDLSEDPALLRERVAASGYSRLPVIDGAAAGKPIVGYLFQLDLLAAGLEGGEEPALADLVRPLSAIGPSMTLDRALGRLRAGGLRIALVGSPEAPLGIVTLKDLIQTISGELGGW